MKVELVDYMGDDLSVVNAARVSFNKMSDWEYGPYCDNCADYHGPYLSEADEKLIRYLAKHDHWTPFAHTAITLRMQAPVPIRTQCFKHKQGFVENEESRRYINTEPELFMPEFRTKADKVKQGSGGPHPDADQWLFTYQSNCHQMIWLYEEMIQQGICPEQARFILPQGVEVNWIWTGNLYSYANFYLKRTHDHAQKEIRDLAEMVGDIIEPLFSVSWKALTQGE